MLHIRQGEVSSKGFECYKITLFAWLSSAVFYRAPASDREDSKRRGTFVMNAGNRDFSIDYPNPAGVSGSITREKVQRGRTSLRYFLGDDERRSRFFADCVNDDRVLAIRSGDKVIGYAAFFMGGRGPLSPRFSRFIAEYGALKGVGNFLLFRLTEPCVAANSLYIYNINVLPDYRGQGGGVALVDALCDLAVSSECKAVTLQVAAHNKAMMLYLKKGFVVTGAIRTRWLRRFFPFDCLVSMEKKLG